MTDDALSTPAQARERLFGDILSLHDTRNAAFLSGALAPGTLDAMAWQGEALLRALATIDDSAPRNDDTEQAADPVLQRMEAKLDVLTLLVSGFAAAQVDADPVVALEWSARGAVLDVADTVAAGDAGRFRVTASDWLPTPLVLPARVIATEATPGGTTRAWLQFEPLSPALQDALERHVFRIHRREVAESRQR